jgi:hypothetical protein
LGRNFYDFKVIKGTLDNVDVGISGDEVAGSISHKRRYLKFGVSFDNFAQYASANVARGSSTVLGSTSDGG